VSCRVAWKNVDATAPIIAVRSNPPPVSWYLDVKLVKKFPIAFVDGAFKA
jgi:hypothetical protein